MALSFISTGLTMIGTANDDYFIAHPASTGTNANTVLGGEGDDWVMGDSGTVWAPSGATNNGSTASALILDTSPGSWTTDENPLFGSGGVPHTTAIVEATIGQSEFFRVNVGAGQTITIDIDYGFGSSIGTSRDLVVELMDVGGNIITSNDDSISTQGGLGSFPIAEGSSTSRDPYLSYTVGAAGAYYINVRPFGGGVFTENNTFLLNVSVTGHATGAASVMGADVIDGGAGDDSLFGQGGNDTIDGGLGDDLIHGGSGVDFIRGGGGADTLYGGEGTEETVRGGAGDDILHSGGEGHYYGDKGNDMFYAGTTAGVNEVLDGGKGRDTLDTTSFAGAYEVNLRTGDTSFGEIFLNFENITTGAGSDTVTATSTDNVISTSAGTDTIFGRGGDDTIAGGSGGDRLAGEAGKDTLDYSSSGAGVTISLAGNSASGGDATGDVISGFENITGSNALDVLTGSNKANRLIGNFGSDTLSGKGGNDVLAGGSGSDTLSGGGGRDVFLLKDAFDVDIIEDFNPAADTIRLDNELFTALISQGRLREGAFHKSASGLAHDASDRIIYATDTGVLFYDADGNGALAPVQFALLVDKPSISHSDFAIV